MDLNGTILSRRDMLQTASCGFGYLALSALLAKSARANGTNELAPKTPPLPARTKRVIFLCMAGGPSHLETFDYKPRLAELHGKPMPKSITEGQPIAQLQGSRNNLKCLGPQHPFKTFGQSGQSISSALQHIGGIADEICIIRSMVTQQINHDPAHTFMNTGALVAGRPSMGSWVTYGLGSEGSDLPGFVVLSSVGGAQDQPIASRQWHSGFLPSRFQGVHFHSTGDPVLYISNPKGVDAKGQGAVIDAVNSINRLRNKTVADPEIDFRVWMPENLQFFHTGTTRQYFDLIGNSANKVEFLVPLQNEPTSWVKIEYATDENPKLAGDKATIFGQPIGRWLENHRPIGVSAQEEMDAHQIFSCCNRTLRSYSVNVACKIRVLGSATYGMCSIARGRSLAGMESESRIWDLAAAWLLVEEAGGSVRTLDGSTPFPLMRGHDYSGTSFPLIAAANPELLNKTKSSVKRVD